MRVSNELGAGHPKSAYFSVWVVTAVSTLISVILSIVILCLRNYISYLFTEGEVVSNAVADLCPLLAITLILNGIQPVLSGIDFRDSVSISHVNLLYATTYQISKRSIQNVLYQLFVFIIKKLEAFLVIPIDMHA